MSATIQYYSNKVFAIVQKKIRRLLSMRIFTETEYLVNIVNSFAFLLFMFSYLLCLTVCYASTNAKLQQKKGKTK